MSPVVLKGACHDTIKGTCERPEFPSWAWRFNRNQYMTHYYPWIIREEQKYPNYRNMGLHRDFRFHPNGPNEGPRPMVQLGATYCEDLVLNRQAGFGNAALGKSPGPAPPRLFPYTHSAGDELYKVNEINLISPGMSMLNYQYLADFTPKVIPQLNPSHYLDQTLGQVVDIPGTFPHFNKPLPATSARPPRLCITQDSKPCSQGSSRGPLTIWQERHAKHVAGHALEKCSRPQPSSLYC